MGCHLGCCYSSVADAYNSLGDEEIVVAATCVVENSIPTLLSPAHAEKRNGKSVFVSSQTVDLTEYGRGTLIAREDTIMEDEEVAVYAASCEENSMPAMLSPARAAKKRDVRSVFVSSQTVDLTMPECGRGEVLEQVFCATPKMDVSRDTRGNSAAYGDTFSPTAATQDTSSSMPTQTVVGPTGEAWGTPLAQFPCDSVESTAPKGTVSFNLPRETSSGSSEDSIDIDLTRCRSEATIATCRSEATILTLTVDLTSIRSE